MTALRPKPTDGYSGHRQKKFWRLQPWVPPSCLRIGDTSLLSSMQRLTMLLVATHVGDWSRRWLFVGCGKEHFPECWCGLPSEMQPLHSHP
uniref:Uncharacterized protein n=1 Tax=Nymphaea colorata TaxID=210225 RepID=A0A5K1CTT7_9MAGN